MRSLLLTLTVMAALAAASSPAHAKGVSDAQVCGATGCRDIAAESHFAAFAEGEPTDPPARAAPFVTVQVKVEPHPGAGGATDSWSFDYLPSLGITRGSRDGTGWVKLNADWRSALDTATAGMPPRPAAQLSGVAQPPASPAPAGATPWWPLAGAIATGLLLVALLGRYATSALKARPRASKSAN